MFQVFFTGCSVAHLGLLACFIVFALTIANPHNWVGRLLPPAEATPEAVNLMYYCLVGLTGGSAILAVIVCEKLKRKNRATRPIYEVVPDNP